MTRHCSKCGEELLGAVNRCWRCGTDVPTNPVAVQLSPSAPVKPTPPPGAQPAIPPIDATPAEAAPLIEATAADSLEAETVESPAEAQVVGKSYSTPIDIAGADQPESSPDFSAAESSADAESPLVADLAEGTLDASANAEQGPSAAGDAAKPLPPGQSSQPIRQGSPFAARPTAPVRPIAPTYPQDAASTGGAFAAVLLGIMGLIGAFFTPIGGLITATLGIALGIWGLYSRQRGIAILGTLLCFAALTVGGIRGAIQLHYYWNAGDDGSYVQPEQSKQW